jgi:LuxR family quorum sensing-dependent transcriptional regulator
MEFARETFDFIDRLNGLSTVDAVMDAAGHMLGRYGFERFSFSGMPRSNDCLPGVVIAHRFPAELFKVYIERSYIDIDPRIRRLRQTTEPFRWLDVPGDCEREPRTAELASVVHDFGISQAFYVPIPSPTGTFGNVWMSGPKPDLTTRTMPALHLVSLYAFDRINRLAGIRKHRPQLTQREREVLTWAAHGKSAWEIGEILGIAKRTVDEHARTAFRKLGAANRTQAVAIAVQERLIGL